MNSQKEQADWGSYYYQSKRKAGKTRWVLDMIHSLNNSLPSFNELFDEESFYVFATFFVIFTICFAIFLAKCVGIKIKEHDIQLNRDWGDPRVADPFRFPWNSSEHRHLIKKHKKE